MLKQRNRAFTVVELLIVVVVIAIVATITVVAYRGMRERAITASITTAVDQWDNLLQIQVARNGPLPETATAICLGRASTDFPEQDGFSAGECLRVGSTTFSYDASYFTTLQLNSSDIPDGLLPITTWQLAGVITYTSRGVLLVTNPAGYYSLAWFPQISGECGRGKPVISSTAGQLTGDYCELRRYY